MSGTVTVETTTLAVTVATEPALEITVTPAVLGTVSVDIGGTGPQGPAGPAGAAGPAGPAGSFYLHTQSSASTTWAVNHNLGFQPIVNVRDAGSVVVDADVVHTSANQLIVTFITPQTGTVRCA